MRYILTLLLMLIPVATYGDGVDELRKAIDYEMQKVRYIPPQSEGEASADRGKLLKALSAFDRSPVGFRPVITVLPGGVRLPVGVVVSADRRYVRIGLSPMFSTVGNVTTFNFGR